MPRVYFVKEARKDNPVVKKGESYYWWKHAFGPKKFSKERPKASQLTQSSYLSQLYALQEGLSDRFTDFDSLQDELQSIIDDLNQLGDECQDSLDSMPEHLQDSSSSGEMLQERIDAIEMATSEMESIDVPEEPEDWNDENSDYKEMNAEERETFQSEWKKERIDEFVQSIEDAWPDS